MIRVEDDSGNAESGCCCCARFVEADSGSVVTE